MNMDQYQRLLAAAADFSYTVELENGQPRKVVYGEGIAAVTGYGPEECQNGVDFWTRLIPGEDRKRLASQIAALISGGKSRQVEHGVLHRDGSMRRVRNTLVPRHDCQDALIAIDCLVTDITEQEALKKKLLHAQKIEAVGQLALGISHDFNNILTVILGFAELAKMRLPGDGQLQGYFDRILTVSCRGRDLVRQILTFSRSGPEERRPLEIQYVVKEAVHLLRALLPASIQIGEEIDRKQAAILAGPAEIHQIVMNLAINAWHAMPKGGMLRIGLCSLSLPPGNATSLSPGDYVCLEVSDSGEGIAADILPRIFEPHFTTRNAGEGSGLGLFMVREIARNLGGGVEVDSRPGEGCTFRVFIPGTFRFEGPAALSDSGIPCGKARILLADDEPLVLEATGNVLTHFGHDVTSRESGPAVLDAMRRQPGQFQLIILNQNMPGMSGLEAAMEARRLEPNLPILLLTGLADTVSRERFAELGNCDLMLKPLTALELGRTVGRILQQNSLPGGGA